MRSHAILAFLIASCLSALGQTNQLNATLGFTNQVGSAVPVMYVTVTPLCPQIVGVPYQPSTPLFFRKSSYPTLTNGFLTISNIQSGYSYAIQWNDGYSTMGSTNLFPAGLTGTVNATTYKGTYIGGTSYPGAQFAYLSTGTGVQIVTGTGGINVSNLGNGVFNIDGNAILGAATNQIAAITNGLATVAYVTAAINTATNGLSSGGGSTNGLATIAYVNASTNGLVTAAVTNGLATIAYANSLSTGGASTNGLATTNYVNIATNSLALYVQASTNGFVVANVTNGLATVAYVNTSTNGLVTAAVTNGLASQTYAQAQAAAAALAATNTLSAPALAGIEPLASVNPAVLTTNGGNGAGLTNFSSGLNPLWIAPANGSNAFYMAGGNANYLQGLIVNTNPAGSSDFVLQFDNGSANFGFLDIFADNSKYPRYSAGGPDSTNDAGMTLYGGTNLWVENWNLGGAIYTITTNTSGYFTNWYANAGTNAFYGTAFGYAGKMTNSVGSLIDNLTNGLDTLAHVNANGVAATNYVNASTNAASVFSLGIGANGTNFTLSIGANDTNQVTAATNALKASVTAQINAMGAAATNYVNISTNALATGGGSGNVSSNAAFTIFSGGASFGGSGLVTSNLTATALTLTQPISISNVVATGLSPGQLLIVGPGGTIVSSFLSTNVSAIGKTVLFYATNVTGIQ